MNIRKAKIIDLQSIADVYNESVLNTTSTMDINSVTLEERKKWFSKHNEKFPIIVYELDGVILGWASLSQWSHKSGYNKTAEISVYVFEKHQGKGIGKQLTTNIIETAVQLNYHCIVARIDAQNTIKH